MNRKWWMVVAGAAAFVALVVGVRLGQSVIESPDPQPAEPSLTRFHEPITDVSISYPGNWTRLDAPDREIRLLATADASVSLSMRVTKTGLAEVTSENVGVLRQLTDGLLGEDKRTKMLSEPMAVELSGLAGFRYRYTYKGEDGVTGAHVHYFLFKQSRLIQLVFQAARAERLAALEPAFDKIASTFEGNVR